MLPIFANGAATAAFSAAVSEGVGAVGGRSEGSTDEDYTPVLGKGESRGLTEGERQLVVDEFGEGTIDLDKVQIHRKKAWLFHRKKDAMAPDGDVYFHPKGNLYRDDFSQADLNLKGLFIHEIAHVYQVQTTGQTLWKLSSAFDRKYEFSPEDIKGGNKTWDDFGIEQQGDIVKYHYWARQGTYPKKWRDVERPTVADYERVLPYR